jgi:hypothetical protein
MLGVKFEKCISLFMGTKFSDALTAPLCEGNAQTSLCEDMLEEILVFMVHQILDYSGEVNRSISSN